VTVAQTHESTFQEKSNVGSSFLPAYSDEHYDIGSYSRQSPLHLSRSVDRSDFHRSSKAQADRSLQRHSLDEKQVEAQRRRSLSRSSRERQQSINNRKKAAVSLKAAQQRWEQEAGREEQSVHLQRSTQDAVLLRNVRSWFSLPSYCADSICCFMVGL
jgi:hypothetical protein